MNPCDAVVVRYCMCVDEADVYVMEEKSRGSCSILMLAEAGGVVEASAGADDWPSQSA